MNRYSRTHLSDRTLLHNYSTRLAGDCDNTAELLADMAEVEERKFHLKAGYPSMFAYCVGEHHLCPNAALNRIRVARVARHFPILFEAIADGRLNLTSVLLLSKHLTPETVDDLVAAASHKSKSEISSCWPSGIPDPGRMSRSCQEDSFQNE